MSRTVIAVSTNGVRPDADTSLPSLDYQKLKPKAGVMGKLFAGKALKQADKAVKEACSTTNNKTDSANTEGSNANGVTVEGKDDAEYAVDEGQNGVAEGEQAQAEGEAIEQPDQDELMVVAETYTQNTQYFAGLSQGVQDSEAEAMAGLQSSLDTMNNAGMTIANIVAEMGQIEASIISLEGSAGSQDTPNPAEFGTSMAAAGGANSAYSLNTPGGSAPTSGPSSRSRGQGGGLIYSANAKQSNPTQVSSPASAQAGGGSTGATGASSGADTASSAEALYARLTTLSQQLVSTEHVIQQSAESAIQFQRGVAMPVESAQQEATEAEAQGQEEQRKGQEVLKVFNKISEVGTYTKGVGMAVTTVGTTVSGIGTAVQIAGTSVSGVGKLLKGTGAILQGIGAGLLPTVFTAPAGVAVNTAGGATQASGNATEGTGEVLKTTGKGTIKAGKTVADVGKGVQLAGDGLVAVGSAGTSVVHFMNGEILAGIGAALTCLGSCASVLGNTAAFADSIGQAKDGFLKGIANADENITNLMGKCKVFANASAGGGFAAVGGALNAAGGVFSSMQPVDVVTGKGDINAQARLNTLLSSAGNSSYTQSTSVMSVSLTHLNPDKVSEAKRLGVSVEEISKCKSNKELDDLIKKKQEEQNNIGNPYDSVNYGQNPLDNFFG